MLSHDRSSLRSPQDFISWLDHLAHLKPPCRHLLVGAGTGSRDWVPYLESRGERNVTIIEADEGKLPLLERRILALNGWKICNQVVAPLAGCVTFHHASLASESGLLPSESLRSVWPNIRTERSTERDAVPLHELLARESPDWLWLDCLPALPFLNSEENALDQIEVIVPRVLLEVDSQDLQHASLASVRLHLTNHGFRHLATAATHHPKIGYAIFLRDHRQNEITRKVQTGDPQASGKPAGSHTFISQDGIITGSTGPQTIASESLAFYAGISKISRDLPPPFLLIDSKSIPRAGIHYLKNTLSRLLGDHFSFCEWYREVGCCKEHPCKLTGFANPSIRSGDLRIRLIKSHDFSHSSPVLPASPHLHRLILVRDPLFVLTSWFELEQLERHSKILARHGIHMPKIWLSHEPEVLSTAYEILDGCFLGPARDYLATWLSGKADYITRFLERWVVPLVNDPLPYTHLVDYSRIDEFIVRITSPYHDFMSGEASRSLVDFSRTHQETFRKREDPLLARTSAVTSFLKNNESAFRETAEMIIHPFSSGVRDLLQQ